MTLAAVAPFIAPAIGGALSLFGGSQQRSAADKAAKEAEKAREEMLDAQFERSTQEWELDTLRLQRDFFWEQAAVEEARVAELKVAGLQQEANQRTIWSEAQAYSYGAQAMFDQYVVGENLRMGGAKLEFAYNQNQTMNEIDRVRAQSMLSAVQTDMQIAGYLNQVRENALQADIVGAKAGQKVDALVTAMASAETRLNFEYETRILAAMMDDAVNANRGITRTGGGNTAKLAAMDALKRGLRAYGDVKLQRDARAAQLGVLMNEINSVDAKQVQLLAVQAENAQRMAAATSAKGLAEQRVFRTQTTGLLNQYDFQRDAFINVTMPQFALVQNEFARGLGSLNLQFRNALANATQPFEFQKIFDPLGPIAGLKPERMVPTPYQGATGNSFLQGVNDFLQGAQAVSPNLFSNIGMGVASLFGGGGGGGGGGASGIGAGLALANSGIGSGFGTLF